MISPYPIAKKFTYEPSLPVEYVCVPQFRGKIAVPGSEKKYAVGGSLARISKKTQNEVFLSGIWDDDDLDISASERRLFVSPVRNRKKINWPTVLLVAAAGFAGLILIRAILRQMRRR